MPNPTNKTYTVHVVYTMIHEVKVKAKDSAEAIEIAEDEFANTGDYSEDFFDDVKESYVTDVH